MMRRYEKDLLSNAVNTLRLHLFNPIKVGLQVFVLTNLASFKHLFQVLPSGKRKINTLPKFLTMLPACPHEASVAKRWKFHNKVTATPSQINQHLYFKA